MMTYQNAVDTVNTIKGRWAPNKGDGDLLNFKKEIEDLYWVLLRKTIRKCNCKSVLSDAFIEIQLFLKNHKDITMVQTQMKAGAIIYFNGQHYTNINITDEVAREYLAAYPMAASLFAVLPPEEVKEVEKVATDAEEVTTKSKASRKKAKK